jgi:hypothetical protein
MYLNMDLLAHRWHLGNVAGATLRRKKLSGRRSPISQTEKLARAKSNFRHRRSTTMRSLGVNKPMRALLFIVLFSLIAMVCTPAALAQKGCAAFDIPAGPEYGNFATGVWKAEGWASLGHEHLYVKISVQDLGGSTLGKKGNVSKGTELAFYDFGNGDTFQTLVSYVVEHNNDPDKFYLNAVETIIQGSGTGRFAKATGTLTDHGPFGISNLDTMDGWAILTTHGSICGAGPAS